MRGILLALLVLFATSETPSVIEQTFTAGETLDYDLRWLRISGGSARMTIAPVADDASRLRITSIAKSSPSFSRIYKVRDEIESVISRGDFSTLYYRKKLAEGKRKEKEETTIVDPANHVFHRKGKTKPVQTPVLDPISVIYQLRKMDLSPGKTHKFTILADGKIYVLEASVLRRETITIPAGTFKAVVVEPKRTTAGVFSDKDAQLTLWYSDDERRLPLRIRSELKFGSITASLRAVGAGVTETEPVIPVENQNKSR